MDSIKKVLFISPVPPDTAGSGRAKRAHQWISVLKKEYDVTLLIIRKGEQADLQKQAGKVLVLNLHYSRPEKIKQLFTFFTAWFRRKPAGLSIFSWFPLQSKAKKLLKDHFENLQYDKIFCFRLYLSEYALFLKELTQTPLAELDMDDIESSTWRSISHLLFKNRHFFTAFINKVASLQFFLNESRAAENFDVLYVCSKEDQDLLSKRLENTKIAAFSNKMYGIPAPVNVTIQHTSRNFLFIGTLDYYPNEEAIRWFIDQVFITLRKKDPGINLNIAGFNAGENLLNKFSATEGIHFFKNLASIEEVYKRSDIVISPLHAGGGTKLKILEAMWFGLPIIATKESVRGLGLKPDVHFLQAETKEEFMDQCEALITGQALYRKIAVNGQQFIFRNYCYSAELIPAAGVPDR